MWCKSCNHRAEPDVAIQVAQHGSGMPVPDWARLLRCRWRTRYLTQFPGLRQATHTHFRGSEFGAADKFSPMQLTF